jgi:hypothetical protein
MMDHRSTNGRESATLTLGLRGWSSALFPAKSSQFDGASPSASVSDPRAEELQTVDALSAGPPTAVLQADGLVVRSSPARRPQ